MYGLPYVRAHPPPPAHQPPGVEPAPSTAAPGRAAAGGAGATELEGMSRETRELWAAFLAMRDVRLAHTQARLRLTADAPPVPAGASAASDPLGQPPSSPAAPRLFSPL